MKHWMRGIAAVCSSLLIAVLLAGSVAAGEGTDRLGTAEDNYIMQTITADSTLEDASRLVVPEKEGNMKPGRAAMGIDRIDYFGGKKQAEGQPFMLTKIYKEDSSATLGRCYAPADYPVYVQLMYYGDGISDCSAATPYQLGILAKKPDGTVSMLYKSKMSYLYPGDREYQEGRLYGGREMMLYPMNAMEYADYVMLKMAADAPAVYRMYEDYRTDEEDSYLADQTNYYLNYMNGGTIGLVDVRCDMVYSTAVDATYTYEQNGQTMKTRIVTMTNQLRFVMYGTIATISGYEMYVPYLYVLTATEEEFDAAEAAFELFISNTRVTDEFIILNTLRSEDLIYIMDIGYPYYDNLDAMESEILGYDYGTYDTEEFCDYIRDQNEYTTSDGRTFKVPTSFDYVYEGDDGTIYTTNTTEQPAGSTRLYANQ